MSLFNRIAKLEAAAADPGERYREHLEARYESRLAAADAFMGAVPTDDLLGEFWDALGGPDQVAGQVAEDGFEPADDAPAVVRLFFSVIQPHGPAKYPTPMPAEWLRYWLDHPGAELVGASSACGWCGSQLPYLTNVGVLGSPGYYQCRPVAWNYHPCCRPDDPPEGESR